MNANYPFSYDFYQKTGYEKEAVFPDYLRSILLFFCLFDSLLVNFQIKYTQGGSDNLETARSYFAQACKLNPNNMRAQFGLLLVSINVTISQYNAQV